MVVHQHLLLPDLGQPICDKPQGHIWGAASRRIGNDLYWLVRVRPGLRISPGNVRYRQQPRQHIAGPILFHLTLQRSVRACPQSKRVRTTGVSVRPPLPYALALAPTAESSPAPENFFQKRPPSERLPPFWGQKSFLGRFSGEGA